MSRKKSQKADEFAAMKQLYEVLKPFDDESRGRMLDMVEAKIIAEQPKPRVMRKRTEASPPKVYGVVIEQGEPDSEAA